MDNLKNITYFLKAYYSVGSINKGDTTKELIELVQKKKSILTEMLTINLPISIIGEKQVDNLTSNLVDLFNKNNNLVEIFNNINEEFSIETLEKISENVESCMKATSKFEKSIENLVEDYFAQIFVDIESKKISVEDAYKAVRELNIPKEQFEFFENTLEEMGLDKEAVLQASEDELNEDELSNDELSEDELNDDELSEDELIEDELSRDEIDTEQQAIENNEGSLENSNIPVESLDKQLGKIKITSSIGYGAEVSKTVHDFNVNNERKRIEKLMEKYRKNGKLSLKESSELHTLMLKSEIRKKKGYKQNIINKAGDFILKPVNDAYEKNEDKLKIEEQKNASARFVSKYISNAKIGLLTLTLSKLQLMQDILENIQLDTAMLSQDVSEKLLTARAIGTGIKKKASNVINKVKKFIHKKTSEVEIIKDSNAEIIMTQEPVMIDSELASIMLEQDNPKLQFVAPELENNPSRFIHKIEEIDNLDINMVLIDIPTIVAAKSYVESKTR